MNDKLIQVAMTTGDVARGINPNQDQLLREASWEYNHLVVDVPSEYREANLKFLGGRWIESVL